jgi:hypothetical protein
VISFEAPAREKHAPEKMASPMMLEETSRTLKVRTFEEKWVREGGREGGRDGVQVWFMERTSPPSPRSWNVKLWQLRSYTYNPALLQRASHKHTHTLQLSRAKTKCPAKTISRQNAPAVHNIDAAGCNSAGKLVEAGDGAKHAARSGLKGIDSGGRRGRRGDGGRNS